METKYTFKNIIHINLGEVQLVMAFYIYVVDSMKLQP